MSDYLDAENFSSSSPEQGESLARALDSILREDFPGDMYALLAGYQRILADNRQRDQWPGVHARLQTLFQCGTDAVLDGPMIGIPVSIRDSDYFRRAASLVGRDRSLFASVEWMATAWNMTFADTGLWMGKTFEPVDCEMVADRTGNNSAMLEAYDPRTTRIGRNFFREPADPDIIQGLGLPVLTRLWNLRPRPQSTDDEMFGGRLLAEHLEKEKNIPYSRTGGIFLANRGVSVVPEMNGRRVFQLNYRWPRLHPAFPMTLLIDELVRIDEGIYLGQLVFATRHFSLGALPHATDPDRRIELGQPYTGESSVDYGYRNNGYFLMMDPAFADKVYADTAFPQLRPRRGESGYHELGYDREEPLPMRPPAGSRPGSWPEITDWVQGWEDNEGLRTKFTTFLTGDSPRPEDGDVRELLQPGESILQMLARISREVSAQSALDDRLVHFEKFNRLFRSGIAPRVENGLFRGHGSRGYNCRVDGSEPRDWYGVSEVARGFDFYHGANLNLHLGFRDTFCPDPDRRPAETLVFPGALGAMLAGNVHLPNVLDLVWHSIGKYIFPWAGKSFEKISGRKLSMLLDESDDLAERYPERVRELKMFLASRPHYELVRKAAGHHWAQPGLYAEHLRDGPWDGGMGAADREFWEEEARNHWVDGCNIQDRRIVAADALFRIIDMNYREPDPSLQAISEAGPSPFARQGYIFLGVSGRDSILPVNSGGKGKKKVFQFHYRYPLIGGPAPIGFCLDELVEIADGLFLGQLIYATALDVPYRSSVDPEEYRYQLFGYFLLMDDAWEYHRRAIRLDTWQE